MKKIILSALFIVLINPLLFSQKKVDLDASTFNYEYVELPEFYTEPENRTCNVVTNNGSDYQSIFDNNAFNRKININGFKQISDNAYVNIEIMLENLILENGGVVTNTKKNADGSYSTADYTVNITCRGMGKYIVNCNGRVNSYPITYSQTVKKTLYNSNDANNYYYNNVNNLKQQFSREFATSSIDKIFANINSLYGYRVRNEKGNLWVLMTKDHPHYKDQQDALVKIQKEFANLTYTSNPLPVYENLQATLKYYEGILPTVTDPEDKKQKKIRYACYFNMMNIYYALDLPEKAKVAADALYANDYDKNDGKVMSDRATQLTKSLDNNKLSHRHLTVDPLYIR